MTKKKFDTDNLHDYYAMKYVERDEVSPSALWELGESLNRSAGNIVAIIDYLTRKGERPKLDPSMLVVEIGNAMSDLNGILTMCGFELVTAIDLHKNRVYIDPVDTTHQK